MSYSYFMYNQRDSTLFQVFTLISHLSVYVYVKEQKMFRAITCGDVCSFWVSNLSQSWLPLIMTPIIP